MSETSTEDVEALRADIEETRRRIAANLAELERKTDPARIRADASARVKDEARGQVRRVRERVMGAADGDGDVGDAAAERTRGNPLGAGLIAFGAGMILASVIPTSQDEQRAVAKLRARYEEPAKARAKETAQAVREDVEPEARRASQRVQRQAQEGAQRTKGDAQGRAEGVRRKAKGAQRQVRAPR
jgi:hypothetical protein